MSDSDAVATEPLSPVMTNSQTEEVAVGREERIPLVEETARIDRHVVETGRVRVRTRTDTTDQILRESLRRDVVGVTRVPVNRTLAEGEPVPVARVEDGVTIIPVLEEILIVEKRLVLKEELHIRETSTSEDVEVPVTLRKQHAVIERVSSESHVSEQTEPSSTKETTS